MIQSNQSKNRKVIVQNLCLRISKIGDLVSILQCIKQNIFFYSPGKLIAIVRSRAELTSEPMFWGCCEYYEQVSSHELWLRYRFPVNLLN